MSLVLANATVRDARASHYARSGFSAAEYAESWARFKTGPFLVVFPILVSQIYGGGSGRLGIVLMMFPLGTIAGSLVIRGIGGIRRKGRALLFALAGGAATLCVLSFGLPFPLFVLGTLVWGLAGSVFINTSRTMAQAAAPSDQRGRVLAAYRSQKI